MKKLLYEIRLLTIATFRYCKNVIFKHLIKLYLTTSPHNTTHYMYLLKHWTKRQSEVTVYLLCQFIVISYVKNYFEKFILMEHANAHLLYV